MTNASPPASKAFLSADASPEDLLPLVEQGRPLSYVLILDKSPIGLNLTAMVKDRSSEFAGRIASPGAALWRNTSIPMFLVVAAVWGTPQQQIFVAPTLGHVTSKVWPSILEFFGEDPANTLVIPAIDFDLLPTLEAFLKDFNQVSLQKWH